MQTRSVKLLIVFACVLSIIGISYAVTQITISNTSTIVSGTNLLITQPVTTNSGTCPAHNDPSYTKSPSALAWTLTTGGVTDYYFCIDNQGTAPDTISVTSSLTQGVCPAPTGTSVLFGGAVGTPSTLAAGTATTAPYDISVCAGGQMTAGAGPTFTIGIS